MWGVMCPTEAKPIPTRANKHKTRTVALKRTTPMTKTYSTTTFDIMRIKYINNVRILQVATARHESRPSIRERESARWLRTSRLRVVGGRWAATVVHYVLSSSKAVSPVPPPNCITWWKLFLFISREVAAFRKGLLILVKAQAHRFLGS